MTKMARESHIIYKLLMLGRASALITVKKVTTRRKRIEVENYETWRQLIEIA